MSTVLCVTVFAMALAAIGVARRELSGTHVAVAWALLAAGLGYLTFGPATISAAIAVAALGGFAALPAPSREPVRRLRIAAFSAVIPVTVAGVALACAPDVTLIAGSGRSSLPDAFYGLSLRSAEQPLQWVLGPVQGFESGIRLSVAVAAPQIQWVLVVAVVLGVVTAIATYVNRTKVVSAALGLSALAGVGLLSTLPVVVGGLSMPAPDPYAAEIKRRLLARGGDRVADTGSFSSTGDISIAMADLAPEIAGFLCIAALAIVAVIAVRRDEGSQPDIDRAFGRDLLVRGTAFLWAAWFVLLIIHNGLLGAPGMGSPGEWVFTGICLFASGVTFAAWEQPKSRLGQALYDLAPGLIVFVLFLAFGLAWRFGALAGLSMGIFG